MEKETLMKLDKINLEIINDKVYKIVEGKRPAYKRANEHITMKFEMKNPFTNQIETLEISKEEFNHKTRAEKAHLKKLLISETRDEDSIKKLEKENDKKRKEYHEFFLETKLKVVEESDHDIDELAKVTAVIETIDDYIGVDLTKDSAIGLEKELLSLI